MLQLENSPARNETHKSIKKTIPERLSTLKEKYISPNSGPRISRVRALVDTQTKRSPDNHNISKNSTYFRKMSSR